MKITNKSIEYRTSIVILTIILMVGGLISYATISKESFPSIEFPNIVITTIYPGASPDDIESLITQHIEREIQSINGIKEIRSTSTEGVSSILVEFNPDVSIDDALQKVRDRVDLAKPDMPTDAEEPLINEIDLQEIPVMTINLTADYPLTRLKEVADDLAEELESIPSILDVTVVGGLEREVQVNVNLNRLQGYKLTFDDIVEAIQTENINIPGGSIDMDRLNYLVRVNGEFANPSEIENIVIDTPGGMPVYIRDVAQVDFGFKDRATFSRLQVIQVEDDDGNLHSLNDEASTIRPVISLNVKKRSGDNILDTAKRVEAMVESYPLPSGTTYEVTGDQSIAVETMVKDLENNIISGLLFVVAVLLFFLGVRNSVLVGIAIPISMFITFILLQSLGYTLNFIILFSLIIALGMLVDNAIVIVENIYRFRSEGHSRFDAARLGTGEVAMPVLASTLTTVAAFAPMLFWPGIMGAFMSYMPLTLIFTLSASLFVALIINPVVTGIFIRLESEERRPTSRTVKVAVAVSIIAFALIVAIANPVSLVTLGLSAVVLYALHRFVMKPVGDRFVRTGLPRLIEHYRAFLAWNLKRDYTVKRAMLRNTFALGSLSGGVVLLILGGAVAAAAGTSAAMILLVPGAILTVVGILGVIVHTAETLFAARGGSVRGGLIYGAVTLVILGLMALGAREVALGTVINLLIMPVAIIALGLLGVLFATRTHYILTDNRAKLITGALGALFGIVAMFGYANPGTELFPDTDPNIVQITLNGALGTNVDESNRLGAETHDKLSNLVATEALTHAAIKNIQTNVGVGGDLMFGGGNASPETAQLTINMVKYGDRRESSKTTMQRIRDTIAGIPGVDIAFAQDEAGPPTGAPVNIEITGEDFDEIVRITKEVRGLLEQADKSGAIAGLIDISDDINDGRPEMHVRIDRERAARAGLSTSEIAGAIRAAVYGIEAGKYREYDDEYDITVRLAEIDRSDLASVRNLTVVYEGEQIPVASVADFEVTGGLGSITRLDLQRVATVSSEVLPAFNGQQVLTQVQAHLAEYRENLPLGYSLSYTGESEDQEEAFGFLTTAFLIAASLIFLIMVAQFNRVGIPFIIMIAVGLSLIGVLLGLILTRTPFGLMTFIGLISLAGIVVNNNIVLLDYTLQLRDRGYGKAAAIIEAGATRLRPVVLTALTTVIGLIPLTLGIGIDFVGFITDLRPNFQFGSENTQFWGPMGSTIIAGLSFATFLTLVVVPVMYSVYDSLSNRLSSMFTSMKEGDGAQTPDVVPSTSGNGASTRLVGGTAVEPVVS